MKFTTLDLVIDGPFARLWMNRPRTRNPIDDVFIRELQEAFNFAEAMPDARAVVLGGRGKAFCSGADMNWMKKAAGVSLEQNIRDAAGLPRMLETIANSPLPVVARIHGDTWAGGVGIVAACDVAIASRGAEFCLNEVRIGLIPATICPYVIRAMGYRAAQRYALTGERFPAAEALRIGLVHEVVAEHELDDRIDAVLKNIAAAAPMATRECKRLMRDVTGQPIDAALANDMVWRSANMRVSPDGKEGLDAFFEKRDPVWLTNVS